MSASLRSCPFCGESEVFFSEIYDDKGVQVPDAWKISCQGCQIDLSCGHSTQAEIAELWNARSFDSGHTDTAERAEELLGPLGFGEDQ